MREARGRPLDQGGVPPSTTRFDLGGKIVENYVPVKDGESYVYLQLLKTMTTSTGPDIFVLLAGASGKVKAGHGGTGWLVQNIPLIIRGPGVPKAWSWRPRPTRGQSWRT